MTLGGIPEEHPQLGDLAEPNSEVEREQGAKLSKRARRCAAGRILAKELETNEPTLQRFSEFI